MFTMENVRKVQEATNLSLSSCKRALTVSGDDVKKAVDLLRKEFRLVPVSESGKELVRK